MLKPTGDTGVLADAWHPESQELRSGHALYAAAAEALVADLDAPLRMCAGCVDVHDVAGLTTVVSIFAEPHSDDVFLPWFVLWVLRCNEHTLHVADFTGPEEQMVGLAADASVPLATGQIVLLPAHKAHWMSASPSLPGWRHWPWRSGDESKHPEVEALIRPHRFVAISLEAAVRPTRAEAEAIVLAECRKGLLAAQAAP